MYKITTYYIPPYQDAFSKHFAAQYEYCLQRKMKFLFFNFWKTVFVVSLLQPNVAEAEFKIKEYLKHISYVKYFHKINDNLMLEANNPISLLQKEFDYYDRLIY